MPISPDDPFAPKPIGLFDQLSQSVPEGWSGDSPSSALFRIEDFDSDADSIPLSDATIRRLTQSDVSSIGECETPALGLPGFRSWRELDEPLPWVCEVPIQPGGYFESLKQSRYVGKKLESALRIFDKLSAWVRGPAVYQTGIQRSASRLSDLAALTLGNDELAVPSPYLQRVDAEQSSEFRNLYEAQVSVDSGRLRIAIRRFNQSQRRDDDTDALIDLWIGLEALFSDSPADVTYKIAMRAALFIEEKGEPRRDLFKQLKDGYVIRSDLVHGRRHPAEVAQVRSMAHEVLRESLRRLLVTARVPEPREYDNIALGGWTFGPAEQAGPPSSPPHS